MLAMRIEIATRELVNNLLNATGLTCDPQDVLDMCQRFAGPLADAILDEVHPISEDG
jgi:hypothetical protein